MDSQVDRMMGKVSVPAAAILFALSMPVRAQTTPASPVPSQDVAVSTMPVETPSPLNSIGVSSDSVSSAGVPLHGIVKRISDICQTEAIDDGQAITRLTHKMDEEMGKAMAFPILYRHDLLQAVKEASNYWCVRYFAAIGLSQSKADEIIDPLISVLLDRGADPRVRAGAAIGLQTVVLHSQKAKDALTSVLYEPNASSFVISKVMMCLGRIGVDDIDLMIKISDAPAASLNALGTNFNAIRSIARSKNPKALELLFKLIDKYPPNSLIRGVVFESWLDVSVARPRKFSLWRDRIAEKMIEVSHTERSDLYDVIHLMGRTRNPIVVDRLIELLEDPKQDTVVVAFAAEALGMIGDRRALPHLQKLWDSLPNDPREGYQFRRLLTYYRRSDKSDRCVWDIREAIDKLSK